MENRKKQELGVDIDDAEEEKEAEKDLLDVLMRAISDEKTLSARDLRDHVFTFLAAGTETTATTTSMASDEQVRHPACVGPTSLSSKAHA